MSNMRLRRLKADKIRISKAFAEHPVIKIVAESGSPPDRYQVEYTVRGLALSGESVVKRKRHLAEIYLPTGYPRQPPQCRMLTPSFHPNIDTKAICVGDHWAAGESLPNLVVRIGEIISYQSYNTKSPLNGEAARWCDENGHLLPVDETDLRPESLHEADAASVSVRSDPKIPKARLIKASPGNTGAAPPSQKPKILKAKLIRASNGTGRPTLRPPPGQALQPPAGRRAGPPAGQAPIVSCPCGRRYRPRRPGPFRCLGCGATLRG